MEGFNNKIRWLIKQTLRLQRSWVLQIENLSAAGNFRLKGDMRFCYKPLKRPWNEDASYCGAWAACRGVMKWRRKQCFSRLRFATPCQVWKGGLWSTLCLARLWRVKHTKVWSGTLCHEAHLPPLLKLWRDKSVHGAKPDGFMFFAHLGKKMVGAAGIEPATFCSQSRRAKPLRYAPTGCRS